jgi:hypothetical protein
MARKFIEPKGLWPQSGGPCRDCGKTSVSVYQTACLTAVKKRGKLWFLCSSGLMESIKIYRMGWERPAVNFRTIVARGLAPK